MENGLYDVTWLKHENDELVDAPLVAECEWGNKRDIEYDFEKLLLARAGVRLMIFDEPISKGMAERLAEKVRSSTVPEQRMLGCWHPGKRVITTGRAGIARSPPLREP